MAFGHLDSGRAGAPLAEINMVPLIDVMLVLLIVFMITAPLLTHAVKVDLPRASSAPNETRQEHIQLAIDATGQIHWNGEVIGSDQLITRLADAATQTPVPELHIRAERTTPYEQVAQVMSAAARQGMTRIGFVTDPARRPGGA